MYTRNNQINWYSNSIINPLAIRNRENRPFSLQQTVPLVSRVLARDSVAYTLL